MPFDPKTVIFEKNEPWFQHPFLLQQKPKQKQANGKYPPISFGRRLRGWIFIIQGFDRYWTSKKKLAEIIGDSGLHFFLKDYLYDILKAGLDKNLYRVGSGELGFHASVRNNMGLDVVIFDRAVLTPDKITPRYVTIAPKVVIEIDVNVELPDRASDLFQVYVIRKVDSLFKHGVEKVIWFFSKSQKVVIALPGQAWQIDDWNQDIEILDQVKVNIADYIAREGFILE